MVVVDANTWSGNYQHLGYISTADYAVTQHDTAGGSNTVDSGIAAASVTVQ